MKQPSIGWFASQVLQKPLYPYQEEIGEAILDSVLNNKGLTISVMMARQMGKNQLSAILEAYLLSCMEEGTIVKGAPTFKPQVITSRLRLLSMLENPLTAHRVWRSYGYIVGVAPSARERKNQVGPRVMFFSAGPDSNIVGATASLLLEVDEAQNVDIAKFNQDLRPMASTTNATTVLYGTAWSDETLLAIIRANNLQLEKEDGVKRHLEYNWRTLAEINPHYKQFVESEIARLGEEHITIRTQYELTTVHDEGHFLGSAQIQLLQGQHAWEWEPDEDETYVMGIDIGGEERTKQGEEVPKKDRDSTVITIAKVVHNELQMPGLEIVHQVVWTGRKHIEQYSQIIALCELWEIRKVVVDRTGLGDPIGSFLATRLGETRVIQYNFTRPSKSRLTYQFLGMISSGCLRLYRQDGAPREIYEETWKQLKLTRYTLPDQGKMNMFVPAEEGHDDILISMALCCEAVREWTPPPVESAIIRPRGMY